MNAPSETVSMEVPPRSRVAGSAEKPVLPYPGLRAFRQNEAEYFCGRSQHRITLLTLLERSRFLAVLGASGSGKSSLVTAGLLPDIARGRLRQVPAGNHRVVSFSPGLNPFRAFARALGGALEAPADEIERLLRGSSAVGFARVLERYGERATPASLPESSSMPPGRSSPPRARAAEKSTSPTLIIVVDQFEELFRFAALERAEVERKDFLAARGGVPVVDGTHNEAQEFIDLLLQAVEQARWPVYVILTMRSDFLHRCETFDHLPGLISANQYLCPQLRLDQVEDAINVPAARSGASVAPELTNRILNDLSPETDQLPVLQHALARMWKLVADDRPVPTLQLDHYREVGGLADAINRHGEEMLLGLCGAPAPGDAAPPTKAIPGNLAPPAATVPVTSRVDVERFFRCLAEWDQAGALVRRPCRVGQIVAETDLPLKTVLAVADVFRATGNHWLRPLPESVPALVEDDAIDLVHESLLRKWAWLAEAMTHERERRDAFLRLGEAMVEARWCTPDDVGRGPGAGAAMALPSKGVSEHPGWRLMLRGSTLTRTQMMRYSKTLRKPYEPTEAAGRRYHHSWRLAKRFLWFAKRRSDLVTLSPAFILFLLVFAMLGIVARVQIQDAKTNAERDAKAQADSLVETANREKRETENRNAVQAEALRAEARTREAQEYAGQLALSQRQLEDLQKRLASYEHKETEVAVLSRQNPQVELLRQRFNDVVNDFVQKQGQNTKPPQTLFNAVSFSAASVSIPALDFLETGGQLQVFSGGSGPTIKLWTLAGSLQRELSGTPARAFVRIDASSLLAVGDRIAVLSEKPQGVEKESLDVKAGLLSPGERFVCARPISRGRTLFATDMGSLGWLGASSSAVRSPSVAVINSVRYLPAREWVLASGDDGSANLWDVGGPKPVLLDTWKADAPVRDAAFDASGAFALIPSGEKRIPLIRLAAGSGKPLSTGTVYWLPHKNPVIVGRFGPALAGKEPLVATADTGGQISLWAANPAGSAGSEQKPLSILSGHARQRDPDNRLKLAWAPDGSFLVSGDEKGLLLVWQKPAERSAGTDDEPPLVLPGPQGAVTALTVSPNSRFIANAGADGTVRVVPLQPTLTGPALTEFGGKDDTRMPAGSGLALFDEEDATKENYRYLFTPRSEGGPPGLTRRLKTEQFYLAARWDYTLISRSFLRSHKIRVRNPQAPDQVVWAQAVDWGPPAGSGAAVDLSPGLAQKLGLKNLDPVEITVDVLGTEDAAAGTPSTR